MFINIPKYDKIFFENRNLGIIKNIKIFCFCLGKNKIENLERKV